ncbi:MAG: putative nucleotidyltransferase component of viral defense system [Candidatus Omnitrophota bacterium]|jgi:predicted nucleotidyltransferase component of viral defense system
MTSPQNIKPQNIEASVRAQLMSVAKKTNRPFAEVLQYYGMERFLYRLSQSKYAGGFVLKGALMFKVWEVLEMRATRDIDFLGRFDNEIAKLENMIKEICHTEIQPDGLIFDQATVKGEKIKEDAEYEGARIKFRGFLGKARIPMQIDVGFGDVIFPKAKVIDYPILLDFPQPQLQGYTAESVVAEKFEAIVKLGALNSRMKDFYDIWLMMRQFDFTGDELAQAFRRTFEHRKTTLPPKLPFFAPEIYDDASDRQTLWSAFRQKGEIKHAPERLRDVAKTIEVFLEEPVAFSMNRNKAIGIWTAPGPWQSMPIPKK